jgi:hypothetical protein
METKYDHLALKFEEGLNLIQDNNSSLKLLTIQSALMPFKELNLKAKKVALNNEDSSITAKPEPYFNICS